MEARFPLDPAPDVHRFPGDPDNCFDLINKYGTNPQCNPRAHPQILPEGPATVSAPPTSEAF